MGLPASTGGAAGSKSKKATRGAEGGSDGVVRDARFAKLHTDPRFRKFPNHQQRVEIDDRFKGMFEDPAFHPARRVDKRGRKVAGAKKKGEDLKRYYRLRDEDEWKQEQGPVGGTEAGGAQQPAADEPAAGAGAKPQRKAKQRQQQQANRAAAQGPGPQRAQQPAAQAESGSEGGGRESDDEAVAAGGAGGAVGTPARARAGGKGRAAVRGRERAEAGSGDEGSSGEEGSDEVEGGGSDHEAAERQLRWARVRGLVDLSSSSSSESSDDDVNGDDGGGSGDDVSDGGADVAHAYHRRRAVQEWGVGAMAANPEEEVPTVEPTSRFAVVDLDWSQISAVDILASLRSFCPASGKVLRVTVHPSEYGLQRLEAERSLGPQGIFKEAPEPAQRGGGDSTASDDPDESETQPGLAAAAAAHGAARGRRCGARDDDDVSDDVSDAGAGSGGEGGGEVDDDDDDDDDVIRAALAELSGSDDGADFDDGEGSEDEAGGGGSGDEDDGGDIDRERLWLYERSKLRWYYAVVECDTTSTALHIVDECDGMEFMRSACKFDLRFIPDEQSFEGRPVRDTAVRVPSDYDPPVFQSRVLQHTDVKLTWDEEDVKRKRALAKRVAADELKDEDFNAYLASESDEEEVEGEVGAKGRSSADALRLRYLQLLQGSDAAHRRQGGKDWGGASGSDSDGGSSDEAGGGGAGREAARQQGRPKKTRGGGGGGATATDADRAMEMEVTFSSGLENLGQRLLEKKRGKDSKEGQTVWDAYLQRRREKRQLAKQMGKVHVDSSEDDDEDDEAPYRGGGDDDVSDVSGGGSDPFFQHEADPFSDPFFQDAEGGAADAQGPEGLQAQGKKKRKGKDKDKGEGEGKGKGERKDKGKGEDERRRAGLEMLLMDDGALMDYAKTGVKQLPAAEAGGAEEQGGGRKGKVSRAARIKGKKEARKREREGGSDDEDLGAGADAGFHVNLEDDRFRALFTSPDFALDPTDPRYGKQGAAAGMAKQIAAKRLKQPAQRRTADKHSGAARPADAATAPPGAAAAVAAANGAAGAQRQSALELKAMVNKLKSKASRQQERQQERAAAPAAGGAAKKAGKKRPKSA